MIILVGESASGKSTVESILKSKYGMQKVVSYTTRPPRDGEFDGKDYNFISTEEFVNMQNNEFIEVGEYRGWLYGSTKEQYTDNSVAVLTPHGLRNIKKKMNNIFAVYIKVDRRSRLIQILNRGDDIDEAIRRNQSDTGMYDGIEDEADLVIENEKYKMLPDEIASIIMKRM